MTNEVNRALTWGGILGVGGALVGSWMVVQSHQAERLNAGGWNSRGGGAPEGVGQISERDDEIAIFQEMAEAYEMAMVEALKVAPMNDGFLAGPTPPQRGEAKRAAMVSRYMARALEYIAAVRGMRVRELEIIYRDGEREGWPRR